MGTNDFWPQVNLGQEISAWQSGAAVGFRPKVDLAGEMFEWNQARPPKAPEPPPFDFNTQLIEFSKGLPWKKVREKQQGLTNFIYQVSTPWKRLGYNTYAAAMRGSASFYAGLDLVSQFIERTVNETKSAVRPYLKDSPLWTASIPLWRGGGFDEIAKDMGREEERWKKKADLMGRNDSEALMFVEELFADAVGEAIPGLTQFLLDLASGLSFSYARGSQDAFNRKNNPVVGGLLEAGRTKSLDVVFRLAGPMKRYLRAPALGIVGGTEASLMAPEGEKSEAFAKGFGTMALYGASSPGGIMGLNDVINNTIELSLKTAPKVRAFGERIRDTYNDVMISGERVSLREALADETYLSKLLKEETGALELPDTRAAREKVYQRLINRFASIENLSKRMVELGMPKPLSGEDPKLLIRSYLSIERQVESVLENKTFGIDAKGNVFITGEGLQPILDEYQNNNVIARARTVREGYSNADEMMIDLDGFLKARRIIDDLYPRKKAGENQHQDALRMMQELKAKYGENISVLEWTGDRITGYSRRVLRMMRDAGRISEGEYNDAVNANKHYVPFQYIEGLDAGTTTESAAASASAKFDKTPGMLRLKGTDRPLSEIESPLAELVKYTYRVMDIAQRNKVARNIGRLHKIDGLDITRELIPVKPIKVHADEINKFKTEVTKQATEIKEEITSTTRTGGKSPGTTGPMQKLEKVIKESLQSRGFSEGEAESAIERVRQSARDQGNIEGENETEIITKTIDRLVKTTTETLLSPEDSVIFRPLQGRELTAWAKDNKHIIYYEVGKPIVVKTPENLYEAMSGANELQSMFLLKIARSISTLLRRGVTMSPDFWVRNFVRDNQNAFIMSTTGFKPFVDPAMAFSDIIGRTDLYYDWIRSGAAHSTFVELSTPNLNRIIKRLTGNESALRYLNIFRDAENVSLAVEEATRIGLFKSAKRRGLSDLEAMLIAREGTTDFGVRGSSKSMQAWSQATAFFNPAVQGSMRFARAQKEHPVNTTITALATVSLTSFITWWLQKDDPEYDEIQGYRRDLAWPIIIGDEVYLAPKPFSFGQVYGSSLERFLDYAYKKDPHAFDEFWKGILESVTPVQGDWRGLLIATAIKPIIENWTDWSMFREMPLTPESKKNVMDQYQYTKYTSEMSKLAARMIEDKTGIGMSPIKLDNMVRGYTGGTGMYALQLMDLALEMFSGDDDKTGKRPTELADYPLFKAFVSRSVESIPRSLTEFYDDAEKIEKIYNSIQDQLKEAEKKTRTPGEALRLQFENPVTNIMPGIRKAKDQIRQLNDDIDRVVYSKFPDDKKRELIKSLETLRMATAQVQVKLIWDLMKKMDSGETGEYKKTLKKEAGTEADDIPKQILDKMESPEPEEEKPITIRDILKGLE